MSFVGSLVYVFQHVFDIGVERRHGFCPLFVVSVKRQSVLDGVAVSGHRYEPYEGQAAVEYARTSAEDILALAGHVPVEAYAGSHRQTRLGHVRGLVAAVFRENLRKILVFVTRDRRIDRNLETQSDRRLETLAHVDLVLEIDRILHVGELGERLRQCVVVAVCDAERQRGLVVLEVVPTLVDVVSGAALQVTVRGQVVLELQAGHQPVFAQRVADFVGYDVRRHFAQVSFGEGVESERGVQGARTALGGLQDVHRREDAAVVAARLVLVRIGVAQRVGQAAVHEAGVEFGGHRREVLLLIVARISEIHGVDRGAAVVVFIVRIFGIERRDRRRRGRRILVLRPAEPHVQRVVAVDVPVHACHELVAGGLHRIVLVGAGIVAVAVDQEPAHFVEFRGGRAVVLQGLAEILAFARAGQPGVARRGVPLALEVGEHEELVLDDRGADAESEGVVPHLAQRQFAAVVLVALELVALGVEVCRDFQVVGSRLGDGVDRTSREAALTYVEGGYRHRYLLQCVERNGRASCGQVAADAEHVVECRAVDRHIRLAVVTAADCESRGGRGGLGREAHDVVHAAVDRGHQFDLLVGDAGDSSCSVDVHRAVLAVGRDDHGFELLAVLEDGVALEGLAQRQHQPREFDGLAAYEREGHRVRASRAQSLQVVVAVLVGDGAVLRARGGVHGDYRSADERLPVDVGHRTVHSRSRHLRIGCAACENREHEKEKFLHKHWFL